MQDVSLPIPSEPGKCLLSEINHPPARLQTRAPRSAARPWSAATTWPRPCCPPSGPGSCSLPAHKRTHHKANNYTLPRRCLEVRDSPTTPCPRPPALPPPPRAPGLPAAPPDPAAGCGLPHPRPRSFHVLGLERGARRPGRPARARRAPPGGEAREAARREAAAAVRRQRAGGSGPDRGSRRRAARAEAALWWRRGSAAGRSLTHHGPAGQRAGGPRQGPADPPRPARAGPPGALGAAVVRDHDEVLHGCGPQPSQRAGGRRPGRWRRRRLRFLLLRRRRRRRPGPSARRPRPFPPRAPPPPARPLPRPARTPPPGGRRVRAAGPALGGGAGRPLPRRKKERENQVGAGLGSVGGGSARRWGPRASTAAAC